MGTSSPARRTVVRPLLLVLTFAAAPRLGAQGRSPAVDDALRAIEQAAGAPVAATLSPATGVATFLRTTRGHPIRTTARASARAEERARAFLSAYGAAVGVPDVSQVQVTKVQGPDEVDVEHVRLRQLRDGVPVTGGELTIHLRAEGIVAVHAKTLPDARDVDTVPTVSPADAVRAAERMLTADLGVTDAVLGTPRLEVFNPGLLEGQSSPTYLAWFMEATRPGRREFIWVDAHAASVLLHFNQHPDALSRSIHDAGDTEVFPGPLARAEGDPPTGIQKVDDAYDFTGDTYDYFLTEHGLDSFDGAGAPMIATVNICLAGCGCPCVNALWNGTQTAFGDGFVLDDVVGHEWTHAVIQHSAGLMYLNQSGALNEAYADIFGETIDLTNERPDLPGARWWESDGLFGSAEGIRNMADPTLRNQPGKMSDPQLACVPLFLDRGGVHVNSGVPNHAYALMVDGGTYNGLTIAGIGLAKAGKIHYRALALYLTPLSSFLDDYLALNQSCSDLIGSAGVTAADCAQVRRALDAVEMASPWPCLFSPPTELDEFLCYQAKTAKGAERLEPSEPQLADAFETGAFSLLRPKALCLPATTDGQSPHDAVTHLASYAIRAARGEPRHQKQAAVRVVNRFGELFVDTVRPDRLLVPTAVDLEGPPPPPAPHGHRLDHYKCYATRVARGTTKFPRGIEGRLADRFEDRVYAVKKPTRLCMPVDEDGQGIRSPLDHFMCYLVKAVRGEPRHERHLGLFINDKLGPDRVDSGREEELCVPSFVNPVCGDGRLDQAGEECDGHDDAACPGGCKPDCTCAVCGNEVVEPGEDCDGVLDDVCPGLCGPDDCQCHPPNDTCEAAIAITALPFRDTQDTSAAAVDPDDPDQSCGPSGQQNEHSVWYRFTAPASGVVIAQSVGSDYAPVLAVLRGSCGSLVEATCGLGVAVSFSATAGETYFLEVASFGDTPGGNLVFEMRSVACADPSRTIFAGGPRTSACEQFENDEASCESAWHVSGAGLPRPTSCFAVHHCLGCGPSNEHAGYCTNTCGASESCEDPSRTIFAGGPGTQACDQFSEDSASCEAAWHRTPNGTAASCFSRTDCRGCGPTNQTAGLCTNTCALGSPSGAFLDLAGDLR